MTINLIHSDVLARDVGYSSANSSFREWCARMRITPVPGRRGFYDAALVRRRLDEAQGLVTADPQEKGPIKMTPIEARRARRGAD